jgi:DNA-binding transcriptional regulator YdaS (Cro superfamily)
MWLNRWLMEKEMTVITFANKLGISRIHLDGIVNKRRKAGLRLARDIEFYTKGEVTVKELRDVILKGKK